MPQEQAPQPMDRRIYLRNLAGAAVSIALLAAGCSSPDQARAPQPAISQSASPESTPSEAATPEIEAVPGLVWEQDFSKMENGTALDSTYWRVATETEEIYNEEKQLYSANPKNVSIEGGALVLRATKEGGLKSGKIDTLESGLSIKQGNRIEVTAKLPKGAGTWPAIWMLSKNQPHTAQMAAEGKEINWDEDYLMDGEIDVMEYYGGAHPNQVESTVQTREKLGALSEDMETVPQSVDGYNTYSVEWTETGLVFSINGAPTHTVKKPAGSEGNPAKWPYTPNNDMYLVLNLAMGGSGGGAIIEKPGDDWQLKIKSVRLVDLAKEAAEKPAA